VCPKVSLAKQRTCSHTEQIIGTAIGPPTTERCKRSRLLGGSAVSGSSYIRKHALLCLRLAAECRGIAAEVQQPELRAHFLRVASVWNDLADHGQDPR
jgi:hypothetical protein